MRQKLHRALKGGPAAIRSTPSTPRGLSAGTWPIPFLIPLSFFHNLSAYLSNLADFPPPFFNYPIFQVSALFD
jgi:hypothetical protein